MIAAVTLRLHLIAGARPNFMKVAPLFHALSREPRIETTLVHTGQHYSPELSTFIFEDLRLPEPKYRLGVGGGSPTDQTARVMIEYEKILLKDQPDLVIVVGDVNSTIGCALAAKHSQVRVAHLESGLRSRDWSMPEEINRVVTDRISDFLWTPSPDADANLIAEGTDPGRIARVGNIMIDSYEMLRDRIDAYPLDNCAGKTLSDRGYAVLTLHRPSNVDTAGALGALTSQLLRVADLISIVFPVHPRTRASLDRFGLETALRAHPGITLVPSLSYVPFIRLVRSARLVITDSGGIQEETSYLGVPCLTARENTERPITVEQGTNRLIDVDRLLEETARELSSPWPKRPRIELWDGHTADRIVEILRSVKVSR